MYILLKLFFRKPKRQIFRDGGSTYYCYFQHVSVRSCAWFWFSARLIRSRALSHVGTIWQLYRPWSPSMPPKTTTATTLTWGMCIQHASMGPWGQDSMIACCRSDFGHRGCPNQCCVSIISLCACTGHQVQRITLACPSVRDSGQSNAQAVFRCPNRGCPNYCWTL
jgi:hypothetical protein